MNREIEEYYSNYFELFRTEGWKQLIEELQSNAVSINSVEATKDSDDLYFRKGQIAVLAYILNLEDFTNKGFADAQTV